MFNGNHADHDTVMYTFTPITAGAPAIASGYTRGGDMYPDMDQPVSLDGADGRPVTFPKGSCDYRLSSGFASRTGPAKPGEGALFDNDKTTYTVHVDAHDGDGFITWTREGDGASVETPSFTHHLHIEPIHVPFTVNVTHHGMDTEAGDTVVDLYQNRYNWSPAEEGSDSGKT